MHEIFLTAVVPDSELERAQALLQGLCGMTAYASLQRVLYFAGPPQPRGLTVRRAVPAPLPPAQVRLWTELHQQLSRQSFVVQVRYGVSREAFGRGPGDAGDAGDVGNAAAGVLTRLNSTPGTLRWMDIPDPTPGGGANTTTNAYGSNRLVMQRKKMDLPDSRNLPAVLQDNNYFFKSELVEESLSFFNNGTEYALVRYHRLPPATAPGGQQQPVPLAALPPWADIVSPTAATAVDPAGQWLFFVRRHVLDDTSPEKMAKALDALEAARAQLAGAFVFRPADRRAHDTRIERPSSSSTMPAPLPQRVRA